MNQSFSVTECIFSADVKIRRQLRYWAATVVLYLLCTGILWLEVYLGEAPRQPIFWLSIFIALGVSAFFALIRFSSSLRLHPSWLAAAQGIFAILCTVANYALSGPARGATLSVFLVVLVFCTFTIRSTISHSLSVLAIALLGLTMFGLVQHDASRFTPSLELIHFLIAASTLLIVAFLTGKLSELRTLMKAQKQELSDALAHNKILATQDMLTSLSNRRHMAEVLEEEERRFTSAGKPVCLALLDIDWFKKINDTYGHDVGDMVLREFAKHAQASLRETDVLARWGGEEFLLLMRNTSLNDAGHVLARLKERVSLISKNSSAGIPPFTFSAGLVALHSNEGMSTAIQRADHVLYRAKHEGRNRVVADATPV